MEQPLERLKCYPGVTDHMILNILKEHMAQANITNLSLAFQDWGSCMLGSHMKRFLPNHDLTS